VSTAPETPLRNALRTGAILLVFALVGTALLAFTHDHTEPVIAASARAEQRAQLAAVLPAFDNDLLASARTLAPDETLGTRKPSTVWLAQRGDTPVALALEVVAPDGYSGDIALLIGVRRDGSVAGVRVTAHRETPGLGDYIELAKSDWITGFDDKSLAAPLAKSWLVKKDGGDFDARAGATITPRAVVKAVKNALAYVAAHPALWQTAASRPAPPAAAASPAAASPTTEETAP
jgi:electron transport complex protein RnfG